MSEKTRFQTVISFLIATLLLTVAAEPANALKGTTVTKISVNGRSVDAFLYDSDTGAGGFINVSEDQNTNTLVLDFSYSTPHPSDPNIALVFQGADVIPSAAVTITDTSAHLALTTPPSYDVNLCYYNTVTFEVTCASGEPITFDLTWEANGIASIYEKAQRVETLGPVVTKSHSEYLQRTAAVNGTWAGNTGTDMSGNILDTQNKSFLREITVNVTP